jgi:hypothetical protein
VCYVRGGIAFRDDQRWTEGSPQIEFIADTLQCVREYGEGLQPLGQVVDRFDISRTLDGFLTRPLPIANGLLIEISLGKVMRQEFGLMFSRFRKALLKNLSNPLVVLLPRTFE